jgi:hypothetical protein
MTTKRRKISHQAPLIVEDHPIDYSGYPFVTLIQYNKEHLLTIIDNSDENSISAYVLDLCGPESVDEEQFIEVVNEWYNNNRDEYPISFEFSIRDISGDASRIFRTFSTDFITRVIGPLPTFNMLPLRNIRRRKRKEIPSNMVIHHKGSSVDNYEF